jgi:porphobilinogen deaminase
MFKCVGLRDRLGTQSRAIINALPRRRVIGRSSSRRSALAALGLIFTAQGTLD